MAQPMAQPMSSDPGGMDLSHRPDPRRDVQGYAPGFGVYPWEPRSFARDRHEPLRRLKEDAENG